ncbi:MAG TPA: hypothetical protein H9945_05160 [Candidatus Gemmiger avicola]|uniref:Uncharacterized protein n=1 Tax=Candidatus Gemmiger avicola TaxID=2838605 RepID=A0A9D2S420_9FIRM|nr:hypothetical protein [Candidatus Gemmiger avicola]
MTKYNQYAKRLDAAFKEAREKFTKAYTQYNDAQERYAEAQRWHSGENPVEKEAKASGTGRLQPIGKRKGTATADQSNRDAKPIKGNPIITWAARNLKEAHYEQHRTSFPCGAVQGGPATY